MNAEVVVYGASGYTGKIICWHLAEAGIPFIAAGRSKERLEEQMALVTELEGAEYECVSADLDEQALTELFTGKKVVYNVVGPFMQLSKPVAQAALNAGCHYFDTTGEPDWMRWLRDELGEGFVAKGLVCAPATSWMWLGGQMAAEMALEQPGIDSLELLYLADSNTSVGSTMSFFRMLVQDQYHKFNNEMVAWPAATAFPALVPGMFRQLNALPWGGGAEPLWYQDDERVRNCSVLVAFRDQDMVNFIIDQLKMIEEKYPDAPMEKLEEVTNEIGNQLVSVEPDREIPEQNRSIIACHGRGNTESVSLVLRGNSPYIQTGIFAAVAVREALAGNYKASGFVSPCAAFGYRIFKDAIVDKGFLTETETQH